MRTLGRVFLPRGSLHVVSTIKDVHPVRSGHLGIALALSLRNTARQHRCLPIVAQSNSLNASMDRTRAVEGNRGDIFSCQPLSEECTQVDEPPLPSSQSIYRSLALSFGSIVLAIAVGLLRYSKPALAESRADPPAAAVAVTLKDDAGEVQERESTPSPTRVVHELNKDLGLGVGVGGPETQGQSGSDHSPDEEAEPGDGENSDSTTKDPVEVVLRSYLRVHPDDKKALEALLFLRLQKGAVDASLPILTKLMGLDPDNIEWTYMKAQADEYAGHLSEAREGYQNILQSKPLSARAWQGLTGIMHKLGEDEEAELLLSEAVKQASDAGEFQDALNLKMLLGQLHTLQGNLEKALKLYETVSEEDPMDYRPYLCQGLVYSLIGKEKEAELYLRRYRKLCPEGFPHRGLLDEVLLNAKSESKKISKRFQQEEDLKQKGKKRPKEMKQPLATGRLPPKVIPPKVNQQESTN